MRTGSPFHSARDFSILNPTQAERLHFAALDILDRTGVKVYHKDALELLRKAGARVDGERAFIPAWMVKRALATAPSSVPISNRRGERAMLLEKGRSYYGTGSDTPGVIDLFTGERREAVKQDVANAAVICDALGNIDFVMSMGLASDVPRQNSYVHQFEAMVLNTEKPIVFTAADAADMEAIYAMASAAAGGEDKFAARPFIILYDEPSSPLQHTNEAVGKLLFCAERRVPLVYVPAVMMGATGPVTPAGAVALAGAEILSGLVIHQLKAEGAPFIYGGGAPPMDMRTTVCSYGAPERDITCNALVAMARWYNLPVFTTGGCSDSQTLDPQAGMEVGFNLLTSSLAGGNLIHDVGYMGVGMTACMELLLLCDDAIGMVKRWMRGVEITDVTLDTGLIDEVGIGGNYVAEEHTCENFKDQIWMPKLLNRLDFESWKNAGALPFGKRANEAARAILENHRVNQLPEAAARRIREISAERDSHV